MGRPYDPVIRTGGGLMFLFDPKTLGIIGIAGALLAGAYLLCLAAVHQQSPTISRIFAPTLFDMPPLPYQLDLIGLVKQPRRPTPQADSVYAAVVALRKAGHEVLPRGFEHHAIDGVQVDYRELIRRARAGG